MRHLWLCAELHKLPSMCCFYTVRDCQKIAEVPPLQIPSFKSFENRTDSALLNSPLATLRARVNKYPKHRLEVVSDWLKSVLFR